MENFNFSLEMYPVCNVCGKKMDGRLKHPDNENRVLLLCESGNHAILEDVFYGLDDIEFISEDGRIRFIPESNNPKRVG